MKKILIALMALLFIAPTTYAENKTLEKARKKEFKQKLKEYKKAKWEIMGSHTMEYALAQHFDRLNKDGEDAFEVEGISTRTKSKNAGMQAAINNACITYAQQAGSDLKGRVVSSINSNTSEPDAEYDNIYATYEREVQKEIRNEMEPSYSICRTNPDGSFEVHTYFVVSERAATKARQRALEATAKSADLSNKQAAKVSEFVRAGFKK